jgi:tetratricopeptide (TPR) repeat protein
MSRASWLAVIAGSLVITGGRRQVMDVMKIRFLNVKRKRLKIAVPFIVLCLSVVTLAGMYFLKKDSSDGRFLTWKISFNALVQNPLGVGLGRFPNAYGEAQAAYFASGKASSTEEYVAGSPEYAFNEFLQIAVESGIVSLLLFIGILVCAFRGLIKSRNWGVMGSLAALLVFACFSYPFSVLPFPIVFVFLLAMSNGTQAHRLCLVQETQVKQNSADRKSVSVRSIRVICVPIICIAVTAFCLWRQCPVYEADRKWKSSQILYQMEMYREAVKSYEPLYPYLNDRIQFLFEYGRSLSQSKQYEKSNKVLQRAMQMSCDPMLYNIMGKNHQAMKEYDLAEKNLRKSTLLVPNRIYPYYLLMKLFVETGDDRKAHENARTVLTKEPTVWSRAIEEMREEAKLVVSY